MNLKLLKHPRQNRFLSGFMKLFLLTFAPVVAAAPLAPELWIPANGASNVAHINVYFAWAASPSAASKYQLVISNNSTFKGLRFNHGQYACDQTCFTQTVTGRQFTRSMPVAGKTYYWKVKAYDSTGWGAWSAARSFKAVLAANSVNHGLTGKLYYEAIGIRELDLNTGERRTVRSGALYYPGASSNGRELAAIKPDYDQIITFKPNGFELATYSGFGMSRFISEVGGPVRYSPDDRLLAFLSDLYTVIVFSKKDGRIVQRFTSDSAIIDDFSWYPDGRLAILTDGYLLRTDVGLTRASRLFFLDKSAIFLNISPDGHRIAVAMRSHIWTMKANGSELKQATDSGYREAIPSFSPDGKFLCFVQYRRYNVGTGDIWVMPANGEKVWIGNEKSTQAFQVREQIYQGNLANVRALDNGIAWR